MTQRLVPTELLADTPYLIEDGNVGVARFKQVQDLSVAIGQRALRAAERISNEAAKVLPQFELAVRSDLVSESDRLEGIDTSPRQLRDLVQARAELMDTDVGAFLQFIRDDERLTDSLGLYRAYSIADEWARAEQRPREFELRALHELVMPSLETGGQYKRAPNAIGGSQHEPLAPWDVSPAMSDLSHWFARGTGDAVLDAAVVHAWLAHIHPFDDGNGRMSRLLANLALVQAHYPPLLLRSKSDRGEYLDALAASDEGDILPIYSLFAKSLRRLVAAMEKPNYVSSKIQQDLLNTSSQRFDVWCALAQGLSVSFQHRLKWSGWGVQQMGLPTLADFELLENLNSDGNCWFLKIRERGEDRALLWFGYRSPPARDLLGSQRCWPSLFIGHRTDRPDAIHKFETNFEREDLPELIIEPGTERPVLVRTGFSTREMRIEDAARYLARQVCGLIDD